MSLDILDILSPHRPFSFGASPPPPPAPVADFTGSPTVGVAPLDVTFADLSTNSPTSWSWDFGDTGTSTTQNPTHAYSTPGVYTVALQATNAGGSDTKTRTSYITVISSGGSSGGRKTLTGAG